jgi:antitoxin ParD1/3/4
MAYIDIDCHSRYLAVVATTMNISLPESLRDFVEEAVSAGGYSSVSEYVRELVRQAKTEKDLEDRLLAALESADLGPIGPEFFEGLKARAKKAAREGK